MSENNLQRRAYSISPYDPNWVIKFESIKKLFKDIFGTKALSIEHVGSTSVPNMKAKPLIDVLIVVENIDNLKVEKDTVISAGYILRENALADRSILFEKAEDGEKTENIHVFETSAPKADQFMYMRDYLRTHHERVKLYENLKDELYTKFPDDYPAYRAGKYNFLQETERLAKEWKERV